jgi:hypothetical protein
MGIGDAAQGFSYAERMEFQRMFALAAARLPAMFRGFWQRWELVDGVPPALVVYADNGSEVLRVTRRFTGAYQVAGVTAQGHVNYAEAAPTLKAALQAAGLL